MSVQQITLVVDHRLAEAELDALFEAGADDSAPELQATRTVIHFDREAETLAEALQSALADVARAGLTVVAVHAGESAAA
jgi:hypothetical protein